MGVGDFMSVTIKDVAEKAGVSIATVSHVINKTRYVSPELAARVERVLVETGYYEKIAHKLNKLRTGKQSELAFVVPSIDISIYSQLASVLSHYLAKNGFTLSIYISNDDVKREAHIINSLISNKRIAGIILSPASDDAFNYKKLISVDIPFVCLARAIKSEDIDCILPDNTQALYIATTHLIKCGHENIAVVLEKGPSFILEECIEGYKKALLEYGLKYCDDLVIMVDPNNEDSHEIQKAIEKNAPTAIIAGSDKLTLSLLRSLEYMGLACPRDVSVIGFGNEKWYEFIGPPLTTLNQNTEVMGKLAVDKFLGRISGNYDNNKRGIEKVPVKLSIRKSTQVIARGPFGEKAVSPDEITLTDEEKEKLLSGNYKVGISFHYSGTAWTRLHESAIRNTLEKFGVKVIAVTDAHFDPQLQVTQLESIRIQNPDAIISIPVDDKITAQKYKEISKDFKLIFISNVPEGLSKEEYASCISVNEQQNGRNAGMLLGEYFKDRKKVKIGLIKHGATFYGTQLRDMMAEQAIRDNYNNIEIVDSRNFYEIRKAYEVCKQMMSEHPEIEGLYISWDQPALEAIRALKELNREDVSIVTCDLDVEISKYMATGKMVRGLSTQRSFEQGEAVALATAKALLGNTQFKYIAVEPRIVLPKDILHAWKDIFHEPAPEEITKKFTQKNS